MTLQTFTLGTFAQQGVAAGSYESIATVTVGAGGSSSIEFTSIPGTYTHLQVRGITQTNRGTYNIDEIWMQLNSDTGNNYSDHYLFSNTESPSTAVSAGAHSSYGKITNIATSSSVATSVFGAAIIDILDYANTNKYKTIRALTGVDTNGAASGYAGFVSFVSGGWRNTNAITSIKLYPGIGTTLSQYSSFALYGIKAA